MSFFEYTIKSGDTMDAISKKAGVALSVLESDNKAAFPDPSKISPGKTLKIRVTKYTFKSGDTADALVKKVGAPVTADSILFVNPSVKQFKDFQANKEYNIPGSKSP